MHASRKSAVLTALVVLVLVVVGVPMGDGSDPAAPPAHWDRSDGPLEPGRDHASHREGRGTHRVRRVIDGDTVELRNGRTVRLVGIDAPERGECGYDAAGAGLADLVLHRQVRLSVSDEDTDQYGRLLRYVDVGGTDAGLRLIERGLAIARYDSRDGYGRHPREDGYISADGASPDPGCAEGVPLVGGPGRGESRPQAALRR